MNNSEFESRTLGSEQDLLSPVKVGIVVPFFESQEYLFSLIESVIKQDNDSWIMLIVDDSGGLTALDLPTSIALDERIEMIVNSENKGIGHSWNLGIDQMVLRNNPEILCVIHADDELEPNYVSSILSAHAKYPEAYAIHTNVKIIGKSGSVRFSFPDFVKTRIRPKAHENVLISEGDTGLAQVLRGDFVFCPTLSFKSLQCELPLFDANWRMVIDLNLLATALLSGKRIVGISEPVYRYRRHGGNLTAKLNASTERFTDEIKFYKQIAFLCDQSGFTESTRVARRMLIVKLHILYQAAGALLTGNLQLLKKLVIALKDSFRGSR